MNEYQDQATWFEVQGNYGNGWEMLTTDDTREGADETKIEYDENETDYPHRVRRMRGLA